MANQLTTLEDLLHEQLRDLYSAETQLVQILPELAETAKDAKLKKAFQTHLKETEQQVARLEQIGQQLEIKLTGHTCKAMQGLLKEGREMIAEDATDQVKDAGLIAAAQRVEHYEIAGYGTAAYFAESIGLDEAAALLRETLAEEQNTDTKLNDLAKSTINKKAL